MSFYRSQTVDRFKVYLPRQSAWSIMNKLGQEQLIHIIPSKNCDIIRHFTLQIKRIEDTLQKIYNLEDVLVQKNMVYKEAGIQKEKFKEIISLFQQFRISENGRTEANTINEVIESVEQLWQFYGQINKRIQMLDKQIKVWRESIAVLLAGEKQYGKSFFQTQRSRAESYDKINLYSARKISFKAGVINLSEQLRFKKTVFRITNGNCLVTTKQFSQIMPQLLKLQSQRVVFFIIYPASEEGYFDNKLTKLIGNFCDKSFLYPTEQKRSFHQNLEQFNKMYLEAYNLKSMCEGQLESFLHERLLQKIKKKGTYYLSIKRFQYFKLYLLKEKQIYQNLNQMDIFNHYFQGEVFIRKQHVKNVQQILSCSKSNAQLPPGNIVPTVCKQKFPSSFLLNNYTMPAQQIVETYGVPRYKQINPSLFTTVTFPFLFGVMFGDIAHGSILLIFGSLLIFKPRFIQNLNVPILNMMVSLRYLIIMMGFFATYCGFIYNDFLSISLNLFGSCYSLQNINQGQQIARFSQSCVYSIGLDPVWSVAENNLNFTNSLKMKIAVIIGVIHMTLGVMLRAFNDIYFKNYREVIFVFIPQLLFLLVLFGYMDFLIILKWLVPWGTERDTASAPSIITQMIAIPLSLGSTQGKPLWDVDSQENFQYLLLVIAGISIPMMFFPVPIMRILKIRNRKAKPRKNQMKISKKWGGSEMQYQINQMLIDRQKQNIQEEQQLHFESLQHQEEQSPSQIIVHQVIQTIQYVLGCVSNTASYLRLWALSLAHSQLSEVFFEKTVQGSLQSGWSGIFMNLVGFFLLACITIGIMLLMDTMECFLHTLRLHWVQFQNKFYKGDGFSFVNFNFCDKINQELKKRNY